MKRMLLSFALLAAILMPSLVVAGQGSAANVFPQCGRGSAAGTPEVCREVNSEQSRRNPIVHLISVVIRVVSYIVGVAAVVGIILSGFRFIVANGDAASIAAARTGLLYSLIGLLVAITAGLLVGFVLSKI